MNGAAEPHPTTCFNASSRNFVELNGIEPMTSGLQSQRSPN